MKHFFTLLIIGLSISLFAQEPGQPRRLGCGVSPQGFPDDFSNIVDFYEEVAATCDGGVVFGNGPWRDSLNGSGNIPSIAGVSETFGYVDMLTFGWATYPTLFLDSPSDPTNNWTNEETKDLFLEMLINTADSLSPTYLFIGNEISTYWELDSTDYLNMVEFYHEAYDSIKAHSPETQVGTVFNYEHIAGSGALTGFVDSYWNAYNTFDESKLDIIGITLYPFFDNIAANDVPLDYLDDLFENISDKPIAITETGWPAESFIGLWNASETEQVDYVDKFFNLIEGHDIPVANWLFLHYLISDIDSDAFDIFRSVSLRDSMHNDRPALADWLSHCQFLGINQETTENASITVYPNPTNGVINITGKEIESVVLYTTLGQRIPTNIIDQENVKSLDLSHLKNGLYLLKITNSSSLEQTKTISLTF